MAVARVHTWIAGEILLASDLNSEFNNILTNGTAVAFPATAAVSMGGFALNFDAGNTMSLTSSTKGLNLSSTTAINDVFTTVVSAATPDIWTGVGGVVNYTGTVTATGFAAAPQAGARRTLVCAGAAPFTAGANMLIDGYASGATFTAAAGDKVHVIAVTTTQFRITPALVTQTLTNPVNTTQALVDGATISWDTSLGAVATVTLAGSRTLAAPTSLKVGGRYVLRVTQDGTGGRLLTWNAVFKDRNGGTMQDQPDTTAAAVSAFIFDSDGTSLYSSQSYEAPGIVKDHAGSSVPVGYLECDASAISRTTYARLFAAVSTTWGVGDGSTTFNLPPSSGRGRIGRGTGTVAETVAFGSVSTGGDTFTVASNNAKWITGQPVILTTTSGLPAGLAVLTTYYLIRVSATLIQFATTLANAQNGTAIDLTTQGAGNHTVTGTLTARTLGETGGEETHAMSITELLSHLHTIQNNIIYTGVDDNVDGTSATVGADGHFGTATSDAKGGNAAMNNMQPFGVYVTIIKT